MALPLLLNYIGRKREQEAYEKAKMIEAQKNADYRLLGKILQEKPVPQEDTPYASNATGALRQGQTQLDRIMAIKTPEVRQTGLTMYETRQAHKRAEKTWREHEEIISKRSKPDKHQFVGNLIHPETGKKVRARYVNGVLKEYLPEHGTGRIIKLQKRGKPTIKDNKRITPIITTTVEEGSAAHLNALKNGFNAEIITTETETLHESSDQALKTVMRYSAMKSALDKEGAGAEFLRNLEDTDPELAQRLRGSRDVTEIKRQLQMLIDHFLKYVNPTDRRKFEGKAQSPAAKWMQDKLRTHGM